MRRLAAVLGAPVPDAGWPDLVRAAGFERMRVGAARLVPDRSGVLKDPRAFFRSGTTGSGRAVLTGAELARYRARLASLAPAELITWLVREPTGAADASQADAR